MRSISMFVSLLLLSLATFAQTPPTPERTRVDAMKRLDFLVGDWSGDGWIVLGRDNRVTFHQGEVVRYAAGGTVLVIDGHGTSTVAGSEGKLVHQAFAVVSFDTGSSKYAWRAYTAANGEVAVEPMIGDKALVWGFPSPGGQVRFTITLTQAGEWHEIGEFSRDGAKWSQFFEMALKRK